VLTIEDGNERHDLPLKPADLLASRVMYIPKNTAVRIALEVFAHDGKVTRENLIAVSRAGPTAPAATDAPANPVELAAGKYATPTQRPPETLITKPNPVRDFVPPLREERAVPATLAEPPPAIAPRMDFTRVDSPGAPLAVPKPPAVSQNVANSTPSNPPASIPRPAPNSSAEKPSQPPQAVSQPVVQPPVPIRQARPVLPANVKAMLPGRFAVKVRVQVDATGKVTSAEPLNTTGSLGRFLGAAATSALRTWEFQPAKMAGRTRNASTDERALI
jgi:TonB family protein